MKIWKMLSDANNYDNFNMCDEKEWHRFQEYKFDGRTLKEIWKPFKVKEIEEMKTGDLPCLSGSLPVFSKKAVKCLSDFFKDNGEILPILYDKGEYYIINITNIKDCVDYNKSDVKRFKSSGKVMRFIKYTFIPERVMDEHIFKIDGYSHGCVFVSDKFKNAVESSGLQGFLFEEVWNSEKN